MSRWPPQCSAWGLSLVVAACLAATPAARGQPSLHPQATARSQARHVPAPFFAELGRPGSRRAKQLLAQARWQWQLADRQLPGDWESTCKRSAPSAAHMDRADNRRASSRMMRALSKSALRRRAEIDNAMVRLRRARELDPKDPELAFELANTLAQWEEPGPLWRCRARRRTDDAIAAYQVLQELAPDYRPEYVARALAELYTRAQRFSDARHEYQRALVLALDDHVASTTHMNLAEVTMHAGDLEGAVEHYQRALLLARDDRERSLSLWGLAVALDRLGEHEAALARATEALEAEGGQMHALHAPGVFFEPRHEIHYYEALGHEARTRLMPEAEKEARREAIRSWREYLARARPDGPFTENARENLARLEAEEAPAE